MAEIKSSLLDDIKGRSDGVVAVNLHAPYLIVDAPKFSIRATRVFEAPL